MRLLRRNAPQERRATGHAADCRAIGATDCTVLLGAWEVGTTLSFVNDSLDEGNARIDCRQALNQESWGTHLGTRFRHRELRVRRRFRDQDVIEVQTLDYSCYLLRDTVQAEEALPSRGRDLVAQKLGDCR